MHETFDDINVADRIVYVKAVHVADLPEEVQSKAEGLDQLYAVHDAKGTQLALVADRGLAFRLPY